MDDDSKRASASVWTFGTAEFSEAECRLKVGGAVADLDPKTLDVLLCLLQHAGEVVTKEEFFDIVWARRPTVDGVLSNAISRLRKALGDDAQTLIATVHRVGYRLTIPVVRRQASNAIRELRLKAGDAVPGRAAWQLIQILGPGGESEVWLAEHAKTRERRVFKFAVDGARLSSLKREATLYRLMKQVLGERGDIARLLEWNFETAPFFLECEYGGPDLKAWAAAHGGMGQLPLEQRLRLITEIAEATAAAHSAGVLHKDLKPTNVLIAEGSDGQLHPRLTDFGSGRLAEEAALAELGITRLGFTVTQASGDSISGTPLYLAPEILAGQLPTVQSDVYSLGVMLYQLVVADLGRPLAPGWESQVADELLRDDIAAAAHGDPAQRLGSAAMLVERLRTLDARRAQRQQARIAAAEAERAIAALQRVRQRRPLVIAVAAVLLLGLGTSLFFFQRASLARDAALAQNRQNLALNRFLNSDLLSLASPQVGGRIDLTIKDAIDRAAGYVDQRFADEPLLAAQTHRTLAGVYHSLVQFDASLAEFDKALLQYERVSPPQQAAVLEVQALRAETLLRASRAAEAVPVMEQLERHLPPSGADPYLQLLMLRSRTTQALMAFNAADVVRNGEAALRLYQDAIEPDPALREKTTDLMISLRSALVQGYSSGGRGDDAIRASSQLAQDAMQTFGDQHPRALYLRMLAVRMLQENNHDAEAERDARSLIAPITAVLGPRSETMLLLLQELSRSLQDQERPAEALPLDEQIVEISTTLYGADSTNTGIHLDRKAATLESLGRFREAADAELAALSRMEKGLGADHYLVNTTRFEAVRCLTLVGDFRQAEPLLAKVSLDRLVAANDNGRYPPMFDHQRALLLIHHHQWAEAATLLRRAITAFEPLAEGEGDTLVRMREALAQAEAGARVK